MYQMQPEGQLQESSYSRSREGLGLWPQVSFQGVDSHYLRGVFKRSIT
jgi:hypothetical protein